MTTQTKEQIILEWSNFLNGHSPEDGLVELCLTDVQKSGLSPETLEKSGVRTFSGNKNLLKERLGFASINNQDILRHCRLIEIPYFNEKGEVLFYRYKVIPSLTDKDGKEIKYLQPKDKVAIPYILPGIWKIKDKPHKPLWIAEGEKKALKLTQHERYAIALSGVWNFRSNNPGDADLFSELKSFAWHGRTVYMAFDQDLWINPSVRAALYELAFKLYELKAIVRIAQW